MNNKKVKQFLLFAIIVSLFSISVFRNIEGITQSEIPSIETTTEDGLIIYDFTNYNDHIYVNYTEVNLVILFESLSIETTEIHAHYSADGLVWTSVVLVKFDTLVGNKALFNATIGPFTKVGEYQLKVNATESGVEVDTAYYRFDVEEIVGIVFLNLSYNVKEQDDTKQYIDIEIDVLGNDIKLGSMYVIADQEEHSEPDKLNKKTGSSHTYWALLGPTNSWEETVRLTFTANTTSDVQYNNSNFIILKGNSYVPESFWRGKFPAILLGSVFVICMTIVVIMNQRKAPRQFDM
ncbi:MAG: hypothetical protein FK733_15175 [Asgard group archaeon]|nr:hypothetical protein [Asgard group archaeon]